METYDEFFEITIEGKLLTKSLLDRETNQSFDLVIIARDEGTPSLSSSISVSVIVIDVNDNTPTFSNPNGYDFSILESTEIFETIGSVTANDKDQGSNADFEFSLRSNDDLVLGTFAVNSTTGDIYVTRYICVIKKFKLLSK